MVNIRKKTIVKIILCLLLLILLLLLVVIVIKSERKEFEGIEDADVLFMLTELKNPEHKFWFKNTLYFQKNNFIYKLDIKERTVEKFLEIQGKQVLAHYENDLVLMKYKNHVITSPEQYATYIEITTLENETIFSKSFHETIKPTHIENDFLFLIDNYPNSPKRTYRVNLEDGDIELFEIIEEFILQGDESIKVLDHRSNLLFDIPKSNDITSFRVNEKEDRVVLVDIQGNIWIYLKNPNE